MSKTPVPRILPCPRLSIERRGSFFKDIRGKVHDLEIESLLRPKQAAADTRLGNISAKEVCALIRRRELYPVLRKNRRVFLIFDCALTDWRARAVRPATRHLFATRSTQAA